MSHFMRQCLQYKKTNEGNRTQSSSMTLVDRVAPRGANSKTNGGENNLNAI